MNDAKSNTLQPKQGRQDGKNKEQNCIQQQKSFIHTLATSITAECVQTHPIPQREPIREQRRKKEEKKYRKIQRIQSHTLLKER